MEIVSVNVHDDGHTMVAVVEVTFGDYCAVMLLCD